MKTEYLNVGTNCCFVTATRLFQGSYCFHYKAIQPATFKKLQFVYKKRFD